MKSLDKLIANLRRLPGVGPKQAQRLALHLFRASEPETEALVAALREAKERIRTCSRCFDYSESALCSLCGDPGRDAGLVCVVEDPWDVRAIERSGSYQGLYHVLHGALSPLEGVGPQALRVRELFERLGSAGNGGASVREVILATDLDTEGEATALYLAETLRRWPVKITRIAQGVPLGGDLDYIDERTLSCALTARREF